MVALRQPIRYLLDSSVCVSLLRTKTPLASRLPPLECGVSAIVVAELWVGVQKHHASEILGTELTLFLANLSIFDFDAAAAQVYGKIRARLEKRGLPIGPNDSLIAAHALSLGATLVTGNVGEFSRVEGLNVLAWQ